MNPHNIGAHVVAQPSGQSRAVAAGTGDATEVDGAWVDRRGYMSAKVYLFYKTSLTAAKTLSYVANLQDAPINADGTVDNETEADFGTALTTTVAETGALTAGEGFVLVGDFDLSAARDAIRLQFTPDLSHSGTDTADTQGVIVLGGAQVLPAAQADEPAED